MIGELTPRWHRARASSVAPSRQAPRLLPLVPGSSAASHPPTRGAGFIACCASSSTNSGASVSVTQPSGPLGGAPLGEGALGLVPQTSTSPWDVREGYWNWRFGSKIRYLSAGSTGTPMLLLHGFGVGAHHWERNVSELAAAGHQVFAVDLMGQGSSWPDHPYEGKREELIYSIDTWTEQLRDFANEVIGAEEPIYVAGNSLGGMLALHLAAMHKDMIRGIILLNATPFWSFRPAITQPQGVWGLLPKDLAAVPAPEGLKGVIGKYWWDNLRNPTTVRSMIQLVYAKKDAADELLVQRIVDATLQPGALDAFLSIVLAPKPELSFDEMLAAVDDLPILMVYGKDDPWVVPLWGQRLKRTVPAATYLELSPSGHCPHHETPASVNYSILKWTASLEQGQPLGLSVGESIDIEETDGQEGKLDRQSSRLVRVTHTDGAPRNVFERFDNFVWKNFKGGKYKPTSS